MDKWEKATLSNNFIFYKVMRHHPDECKHLIEMLLKIKIKSMEMHNEEVIDLDHDAKGIRLDVYVKESKRMHDIELQVINTNQLPERARYYSALMSLDTLKSGDEYSKLHDGHVIFICMEDIFKDGLPVYTFENICIENGKTKLNDRDYKHFFIAPTCATMIRDEETKDFFEFLISNKAKNQFTSKLDEYVKDAKHNMQWRHEFMTYQRIKTYAYQDGLSDGLSQGAQQKAIEDAKRMLIKKYPTDDIAEITGLPLEKVLELQKGLLVEA